MKLLLGHSAAPRKHQELDGKNLLPWLCRSVVHSQGCFAGFAGRFWNQAGFLRFIRQRLWDASMTDCVIGVAAEDNEN